MTVWISLALIAAVLAAVLYRLGVADGLSVARSGRLAGSKPQKRDELLSRIESYDGRKEQYAKHK